MAGLVVLGGLAIVVVSVIVVFLVAHRAPLGRPLSDDEAAWRAELKAVDDPRDDPDAR